MIEIKATVAAVQIAEKKVRAERVVAGGNPDDAPIFATAESIQCR